AWLAKKLGFKRAIAVMCIGFGSAIFAAFVVPRPWDQMLYLYVPLIGFFSGIFGLFTMFLPPLFPTLLRTTSAGFSYNIGRIASAAGVIIFGAMANHQAGPQMGDLRTPLFYSAFLFIPAMIAAMFLPEPKESTLPVP